MQEKPLKNMNQPFIMGTYAKQPYIYKVQRNSSDEIVYFVDKLSKKTKNDYIKINIMV